MLREVIEAGLQEEGSGRATVVSSEQDGCTITVAYNVTIPRDYFLKAAWNNSSVLGQWYMVLDCPDLKAKMSKEGVVAAHFLEHHAIDIDDAQRYADALARLHAMFYESETLGDDPICYRTEGYNYREARPLLEIAEELEVKYCGDKRAEQSGSLRRIIKALRLQKSTDVSSIH